MQIASLLNLSVPSPPATALSQAAQGGADATAQGQGGLLGDSLAIQPTDGQFAGLLAGNTKIHGSLIDPTTIAAVAATTDTKDTTPIGDITSPPQITGNIAIPPLTPFIDQKINTNVVLTQNDIDPDASSAKKRIFANIDKPLPANTTVLANDISNAQESTSGKADPVDQGKIVHLPVGDKVDDAEFNQAVSKIISLNRKFVRYFIEKCCCLENEKE